MNAPVPLAKTRRSRVRRIALFTCALIAMIIAGAIAAAWAPDRSVATLRARWAPPPSEFVPIDGLSVHLRDEGPRDDPAPIVLLHGTSASLHTWEGWVRALSGHHRVITFDLPGFGLTGPDPQGDYRIERYVRFVLRVLDARGVAHCVLGGNSLGGAIAWETAVRAPERVTRLILVDAGGYQITSTSVPLGFRLARAPVISGLASHLLTRSLISRSLRDVYGDPSRVSDALVERYYELTLREGNRAAVVQRFRQSHPGDDAASIRSIRVPTLILWGGRDRLIPPDNRALSSRHRRERTGGVPRAGACAARRRPGGDGDRGDAIPRARRVALTRRAPVMV